MEKISYGSSNSDEISNQLYESTYTVNALPFEFKDLRSRRWSIIIFALAFSFFAAVLVHDAGSLQSIELATDVEDRKIFHLNQTNRKWSPIANQSYFYKFTYPVANSTGLAGFEKLTKYLCPAMGDPDDLGCNALKVGCSVLIHQATTTGSAYGNSDFELHFVDAARFTTASNELTLEQWQEYFEKLNDQMTGFTAFSHNKVTLFTHDLKKLQAKLDVDQVPYMARSSGKDYAHIIIEINGRLFEVVGEASNLNNQSQFVPWSDLECPAVHRPRESVDYYAKQLSYLMEGDDDIVQTLNDFNEESSVPPLLFIGASIATGNVEDVAFDPLMSDMSALSGATWSMEVYTTDKCKALVGEWAQMPGLRIQYVENKAARAGAHSVTKYEKQIKNAHKEYLSDELADQWFGWDHWLDQHIGLVNTVYNLESGDNKNREECLALSREITSSLMETNTPVGQRLVRGALNNTHFYTGYHGSMAWEYNQNCNEWEHTSIPGICACNPQNNDLIYFDKTGKSC